MNVKRTNKSETELTLTITVDEKELAILKQKAVKTLGSQMKLAGFRPGKAPATVVEKQIDQNKLQVEVLQDAIEEHYRSAATNENIKPLASPKIDVKKFVPFTQLEFEAEIEILPAVKLADYKKIKKTAPKVTVTEKEINDVIDNLRQRVSKKESVDRPAKNGDDVIIDFEGVNEKGDVVAGASGKDYALNLGSKTFIPGFEEGLVGLKQGDTKDLKLAFPKDYHAKNLAGTKITFKTTVSDVKEVVLPEADDKFASTVGPFKSLADLKKDIKDQLLEQKTQEESNKIKDEILEEIVKKSKIILPKTLVEDQIESLAQDMRQNLVYRGITLPEYIKQEGYKDESDWKQKALKPQAERRVSVGIVLAEIAEAEKLTVSDAELKERLALYQSQYQQQAGDFNNPEMQREVLSRMLTEKTVDYLYAQATK
jgi:trigger factor